MFATKNLSSKISPNFFVCSNIKLDIYYFAQIASVSNARIVKSLQTLSNKRIYRAKSMP